MSTPLPSNLFHLFTDSDCDVETGSKEVNGNWDLTRVV